MYKVKFIFILILVLMWQLGVSQKTPAVNAVPMADSLVFSTQLQSLIQQLLIIG
jgi:hypothetical protein